MDQRANYLSLILLDALEDENESDILYILQNNKYVDAAYVPQERGIAPLHYVCGMENGHIAKEMAKRFMEMGANPNVCSDDNMTPLHVAAMYGRVEIVKLLLEYGADLDVYDDDRKTPLLYAIDECHFEVVQLIRDHIYYKKCLKKKQQHLNSLHNTAGRNGLINKNITNSNITNKESREKENDDNLTPKRLQYNYDTMSPYYINITHRRHKPQPCFPDNNEPLPQDTVYPVVTATQTLMHPTETVDIFTLTKENLEELTKTRSDGEKSKMSFIKLWQEKVQKSRTRQSILKQYDNINEMIDEIVENDHINFTNIEFNEKTRESSNEAKCGSPMPMPKPHDSSRSVYKTPMSLNKIVQQISEAKIIDGAKKSPHKSNLSKSMIESSYVTVPENVLKMDQQGAERDKRNGYFLQMTEAYVHTDDENGLVFYETKLLTNKALKGTQQKSEANGNLKVPIKCPSTEADSMQSDNLTLPSDYETDALRAELTMFGQPPGPITSTTKRLYIKKLIKCKRKLNTMHALEEKLSSTANQFSVELQRTVKSVEHFDAIKDYMKFDTQSTEYFANNNNNNNNNNLKKPLREGHLKQSFIYMLIDPRISCNLPGESVFLDKFDIWKRFLQAIFYVGKGKTSRPYSHLYDALKLHTRTNYEELHKKSSKTSHKVKKSPLLVNGGKTSQKPLLKSKKLDRILEIWDNGNGVVCLHVFHNIIPIEAYTREAAIIEALSLKHLTNCKRGDYYGPAKTWTMKEKKYLGIALLYKAMNIYLAEGESQLSPCDLI